jgi:hypothetical protein
MRACLIIAAVTLAVMSPGNTPAQQSATAEPIMRVTIDRPRVVVGQMTTLRIEVLAPNYMTAPPELPGFQVRNAVTRQLQSVNINEQRDDTTYAGVRFEFAIYPQEPGSYAIADQKVTVRYAAEPPATREASIALPRIAFAAFIPDAAAGLRPFVAANGLTVEQTVQRSSDQLKVGDAVTRTVTIKADGTPAMLLPPQTFAAIPGLAPYPSQPALDDKVDGRSDAMMSSRVDSITYMLERPGDYALPPIDVRWWNSRDGKIEVAHADAVSLTVAANPSMSATASAGERGTSLSLDRLINFVGDHWLLAALTAAGLALLAWLGSRAARVMSAIHHRRRTAYLQSESFAFARLRHAVRRREAKQAYFALLDWLQHFEAAAPDHRVDAFMARAHDPVLDRQIGAIENELFAPRPNADRWSPRQLLRRISAARRGLGRRPERNASSALPQQLNPVGLPKAQAHGWRKPAR